MLLAHRRSQGEPLTLLQGMCQEQILLTIWPSLGPLDRTNLTPHLKMEVVAVEAAGAVEVVEERHHPDLEGQDKERLSLPMWTTNCMAKAVTYASKFLLFTDVCCTASHVTGPVLFLLL